MSRRSWILVLPIEATLEFWAKSLRDVKARIRPLFTQDRVAASANAFLDGLLGDERRKTGWMRAEAAGGCVFVWGDYVSFAVSTGAGGADPLAADFGVAICGDGGGAGDYLARQAADTAEPAGVFRQVFPRGRLALQLQFFACETL